MTNLARQEENQTCHIIRFPWTLHWNRFQQPFLRLITHRRVHHFWSSTIEGELAMRIDYTYRMGRVPDI